jgi:hypothetical protein
LREGLRDRAAPEAALRESTRKLAAAAGMNRQ